MYEDDEDDEETETEEESEGDDESDEEEARGWVLDDTAGAAEGVKAEEEEQEEEGQHQFAFNNFLQQPQHGGGEAPATHTSTSRETQRRCVRGRCGCNPSVVAYHRTSVAPTLKLSLRSSH